MSQLCPKCSSNNVSKVLSDSKIISLNYDLSGLLNGLKWNDFICNECEETFTLTNDEHEEN